MGFTQIPVIEYTTWTVETPLADSTIDALFGSEIDILAQPKGVPGIAAVDSTFYTNGILQTDIFVAGFGVHIFAEPQSFEAVGNALTPAPASATATVVSSDVYTLNDVAATVLGVPSGAAISPATLEWGHADWQAGYHLANAFQFQWQMFQRYEVIKELVADVAYFGPYAEAVAAGTSEVDVQQYARRVNNRYRALNAGSTFYPVNARRIGSVNGAVLSYPIGNKGVFHPTRDYDLAPVTNGGLRVQGGAGCCQPFRKIPKPVLVEKGIPIGMKLQVQDQYHYNEMVKYLSVSEGSGSNLAAVEFVDAFDSGTSAASAMPELTLDQGANAYSNQQVTTSRVKFKGGVFKLAILIKGVEVWGDWANFILQAMPNAVLSSAAGNAFR